MSNIKREKKITIKDCLKYYFDSLKNDNKSLLCENCNSNIKYVIKELKRHILIFINYEKENKKKYDLSFEMDEEIDFNDFEDLDQKSREKQFFLSSFIACQNMGFSFEIYYTFVRNYEQSDYCLYNGREIRNNKKLINHLKKEKMDFQNRKESWPVVLVYTDKQKTW